MEESYFKQLKIKNKGVEGLDVYIKTEKETFHFPVNPFSIGVNGGKMYETFDILYKGETDFIAEKAKKIRQLSMAIMLPYEYEPYCRYRNIPDPVSAMNKLVKWSESDEMVRLIITDYGFNELVNFSTYQEDESGNSQRDKYLTLDFRVTRGDGSNDVIIEKQKEESPAPKLKSRPEPPREKTYVVKKGDTLWAIAKRLYGNGTQYTKIYNKNKGVIGSNPNLIKPGQKFIIP